MKKPAGHSLSIRRGPSLAQRTTLKLGGSAVAEVAVRDEAGLEELSATLASLGGRPQVLGWGSNILARDGELDITIVHPEFDDGPEEVARDAGLVLVRCGAGVRLPRLVSWAARRGYAGLEGLAGIPGSVGGAVAMNAGSYGQEFCARLESLTAWNPQQGLVYLGREHFEYGYRHFSAGLAEPWVAVAVTLSLGLAAPAALLGSIRDHLQRKKATQPIHAATAGCVFRNPPPPAPSAGRLLDEAGFKGRRLGGVGFSELHANFLVNYGATDGSGTTAQALELIAQAQNAVRAAHGLHLELEVRVLG